jgi:hypothetical protein
MRRHSDETTMQVDAESVSPKQRQGQGLGVRRE